MAYKAVLDEAPRKQLCSAPPQQLYSSEMSLVFEVQLGKHSPQSFEERESALRRQRGTELQREVPARGH